MTRAAAPPDLDVVTATTIFQLTTPTLAHAVASLAIVIVVDVTAQHVNAKEAIATAAGVTTAGPWW